MTIDGASDPGSDPQPRAPEKDQASSFSGARPWVDKKRESFLAGLLVLLVVFVTALQAMAPEAATPAGPTPPAQRLDLVLQGRYVLGAATLFEGLGTIGEARAKPLAASLSALDTTPDAALCLAPVFEALGDLDGAATALGAAPATLEGDAATAARVLKQRAGDLEGDDGDALRRHCGWFGDLGLAQIRDDTEAVASLHAGAVRLTMAILALAILAFGGLLIGTVLAILGFARLRRGDMVSGYRSDLERAGAAVPGPARLAYLETMVFFLLGLQVLGVVTGLLMHSGIGLAALMAQWLIVPLFLWPLMRGETRTTLAAAIGWRRPPSILAEMGWGLVAYVASAPLLALGLFGSVLASRFVTRPPYHPVLDWVGGSESWWAIAMVFIIASAWAPLVEETMFRGAFYHYLRGRLGVITSSLVVAMTFAAIHPQGVVGMPFLIALAVALAVTREWRGSMVASITMHALHNGMAIAFLVVVLGGL